MGFFITFLFFLGIFVLWKTVSSYENKVKQISEEFFAGLGDFKELHNLKFSVQTNRKKISCWDKQHTTDYIIINNKDGILRTLRLYKEYINWWTLNSDALAKTVSSKAFALANNMFVFGEMFRNRCNYEISRLVEKYNPENVVFCLSTFTHHENITHFNPHTGDSWCDKSPDETTFSKRLSPNEMESRLKVLAQYNYEVTEYEYNVVEQRTLMTPELRERIIKRDGGICKICNKKCRKEEIEIDHIKPVSKGGKTVESNLQVLCVACNRKKGSKWSGENNSSGISRNIFEENAPPITPKPTPDTKELNISGAQIGDKITIKDIQSNKEKTFVLLEKNNEGKEGGISISAPIGRATLGKNIGDIIDVQTHKVGEKELHTKQMQIIDIQNNGVK